MKEKVNGCSGRVWYEGRWHLREGVERGLPPGVGCLKEWQHLRAQMLTLGTQTQPRQAGHRNGQGRLGGNCGTESSLLVSEECSATAKTSNFPRDTRNLNSYVKSSAF